MHTFIMKFNIYMRKILINFAAMTMLCFFAAGCDKKSEVPGIELPATSVLSVQSSWGVVKSTHLRLRENPSLESKVITTLWRGGVLEVLSKTDQRETIEGEEDYWYRISFEGLSGWVFGAYLEIFSSKEQARAVSRELK